jgi:Intracellular proteinase inhibitor
MSLYLLGLLSFLIPDSMRLEISLPATARVGEAVPIVLQLKNTSAQPATVYLQGRPAAFDIIVSRPDGVVLWRRMEGAVISAVLQVRELAAGAVMEFRDTWPQRTNLGQPFGPGEYFVTGVLPTDPPAELRTDPVRFRILP